MFKGSNVHYEMAERVQAVNCGGIGAMHLMVQRLGLVEDIDLNLNLLKIHLPYHESDHVLNIAYNRLESRRNRSNHCVGEARRQLGRRGPRRRLGNIWPRCPAPRPGIAVGCSKPWPDTLEALTGQRQMDATAILDYFAPLKVWLDQQNAGQPVGW